MQASCGTRAWMHSSADTHLTCMTGARHACIGATGCCSGVAMVAVHAMMLGTAGGLGGVTNAEVLPVLCMCLCRGGACMRIWGPPHRAVGHRAAAAHGVDAEAAGVRLPGREVDAAAVRERADERRRLRARRVRGAARVLRAHVRTPHRRPTPPGSDCCAAGLTFRTAVTATCTAAFHKAVRSVRVSGCT